MKMLRLCLAALLAGAGLSVLAQKEYRVTVLHSFRVPFEESFGRAIGDGQQVGDNNSLQSGGGSHAMLWSGTPESLIDLHPKGWSASFMTGVIGGRQSGFVEPGDGRVFAALWSGSADSMVLLHPKGWANSQLLGLSLTDQVGWVNQSRDFRLAARWQGTPESMVLLHPGGPYLGSWVNDTDGEVQVGQAAIGQIRPALWRGSRESFVDLTPPGFSGGEVYGVANGQQVGWAGRQEGGQVRPILWHGSPGAFVDLGPGATGGVALATNGFEQVGWVGSAFAPRATVWSGNAESLLDLHQFLPAQFQGQGAFSRALGIDAEGNIIGYARDLQADRAGRAVMWSPVPEPGTVFGLATLLALLATRRRAKTR